MVVAEMARRISTLETPHFVRWRDTVEEVTLGQSIYPPDEAWKK